MFTGVQGYSLNELTDKLVGCALNTLLSGLDDPVLQLNPLLKE